MRREFSIEFTRAADTALRRMPRDVALRIRERLAGIAQDPYAPHPNVTRLQRNPGFRLRVGDWRVVYDVEGDRLIILVMRVGHRGDVYR